MPGPAPPRHLLLVEGGDEEHFVRALQVLYANMPAFDVKRRSGAEAVLKGFATQLRVADRKAVGIVIDANGELSSRWAEIVERLPDEFNKNLLAPSPEGTILISSKGQRFGVWLMPDNQSEGELEHFIENLMFDDDQIWDQAQEFVSNIRSEDQLFEEDKRKKAEVRAWLAVRAKPGLLGEAVRADDLNLDASLAKAFATWLAELFHENDEMNDD